MTCLTHDLQVTLLMFGGGAPHTSTFKCGCVRILHVCPNVRDMCHMRPRQRCVVAYLQQTETNTPHSPWHPVVTTLTATTIKTSTKIDQQSVPLWTISERVLLTHATSMRVVQCTCCPNAMSARAFPCRPTSNLHESSPNKCVSCLAA